jgi:hypothetical protein
LTTWRSIRTSLEDGIVTNDLKHLQFLASIVSAYPCLDIWFRSAGLDSIQVQIYYMQCDSSFIADEPWERNGERPRFFEQITGTWQSLRSEIISALPYLSRLSDEKRNGLANYGAKQPYTGGGLLFDIDGSGNLVIQGRYGAISIEVDGNKLPFEALEYDFDCCNSTVTVDESYLGGDLNIVNGIPGTNRRDRYTVGPPVATVSVVALASLMELYAPYSLGDFGLQVFNYEYEAGTTFQLPQGATAIATPTPVRIGELGTLQGWPPGAFGQATFLSNFEVALPQVSDTGVTQVYELNGSLGFPRFATSETVPVAQLPNLSPTPNPRYYTAGTGADIQSGTWRVTVINAGSVKEVSCEFIPDDTSYSCTIMPAFTIPANDTYLDAWKSVGGEGYGMRNSFDEREDGGVYTTKLFNTGVDTLGLNPVPQGDYPNKTLPVDGRLLEGELWRSNVAITFS